MNSKLHIITALSLSTALALSSCVSSGGETIPLEFTSGSYPSIDGIPNDQSANPNPVVNKNVECPDIACAIVTGTNNAQIAEFFLPGIKSPTSDNWLYLMGTNGTPNNRQNVWVSVDGKPKGCLALNNSNFEIETPISIDFIFLVNNSNNMKEAGDMIYRTLDEWTDALKDENISMAYFCVGYGGGTDTKGVNGACNRSTASELKAYLSREGVSGIYRTMGFNDLDALEQLARSQYQNCDGECGVEALKFANEAFAGKFRPNAIRIYLNITDEPNQPGGDPKWSVESIKTQDQWHAGSGTIHTLFSGNQGFINQVNEYEHPWLLSEYTGGYITTCDAKLTDISLKKLPVTGSLQNCTKIRIANVDDYLDGKYHDVKLTILSGDKEIQASKTFKLLFTPAN